ncbi:sigma factor-like helix-turn-helix DNA-binding protein [Euzebya sp.]|uniref:sigma factor-like helix-turn-helix DNA-binding protein n=1 Tax=Euzebya sp. TaxID=1971409 RepID=UPI003514250B
MTNAPPTPATGLRLPVHALAAHPHDPGRAAVREAGTAVRDFTTFYADAYDGVARALVLTLADADLGVEAADEAMVRAYQRWDTVSGYDNPGGWAYRVGLNWALSLRRKLIRRLSFGTPPAIPVEDAEIADPSVMAALRRLDVKLRAVVVCRLLLDWSVEDTAAALDLKPGTVKSRLHRALATLERSLEDPR